MYCHGYQSWSATGTARLGAAEDPSRTPGSIGLVRNVHHADAAIAPAGELRSELVTVLADDDGALLLGFEGGAHHDGTFRVRAAGDGLASRTTAVRGRVRALALGLATASAIGLFAGPAWGRRGPAAVRADPGRDAHRAGHAPDRRLRDPRGLRPRRARPRCRAARRAGTG